MNKHKVTKRQLLRCLQTVQDNCVTSETWFGESLRKFCSDSHNVQLLATLQSMNAVRLFIPNGSTVPSYVMPLDAAGIVWLENSEKWKDRIWGFVFGLISGVLITVIAQVIMRTFGIV